jgi:hypothetical protein
VTNAVIRVARRSPNPRAYTAANGATDGSIIAAIISAHTATNAAKSKPIVPDIALMPRPTTATPTHAAAATSSPAPSPARFTRSPR